MFFKRRKMKQERIKESKNKMLKLFKENVEEADNYKLVYGYSRIFSFELKDYIYKCLIIGYDINNLKLIIIETDKDFKKVNQITSLSKKDFTKAIYSSNLDEYIIYLNKKKDNLKFSLIKENHIDIDILAYIEQDYEIEDFKDFYQEFKRKPKVRKKKIDAKDNHKNVSNE